VNAEREGLTHAWAGVAGVKWAESAFPAQAVPNLFYFIFLFFSIFSSYFKFQFEF
jgi:hypothetical protein